MPLTLRVMYYGLRASVRAALLFFCAWILLIPASDAEATALGATTDNHFPPGLRSMRAAKAVTAVAPDAVYVAVAAALGPDYAPWMVRLVMMQMADGNLIPPAPAGVTTTTAAPSVESDRDIDGPRFIKVD